MSITATLQGRTRQVIEAAPAAVWQVLEDSARLPTWVGVVEHVSRHADREEPGAVRRCEVAMGGRKGFIVERCLEAVPERRLHHAVDDDSLGFTKLFRDYSFALKLEPVDDHSTLVTCETFYEPRGPVARAMNTLVMRRRFATVRRDILLGLKAVVESAHATSAPTVDVKRP